MLSPGFDFVVTWCPEKKGSPSAAAVQDADGRVLVT
jgi:hypothetical protein